LSPGRSPGIALHAVFSAVRALRRATAKSGKSFTELRIRVVVVGDGPLRHGLEQMVTAFKRESDGSIGTFLVDVDVIFAGTLSTDAVFTLLSGRCDQSSALGSSTNQTIGTGRHTPVVALNGRIQGETFGIANAEALASGAAVVCFDVGANRESTLAAVPPCAARATLVASPFTPQRLGDALAHVIAPDLMAHTDSSSIEALSASNLRKKLKNNAVSEETRQELQQNTCVDKAIEHLSAAHFIDRYAALYRTCRKALEDEESSRPQSSAPFDLNGHVAATDMQGSVEAFTGVLSVVFSSGGKYLQRLLEKFLPTAFPTLEMRIDSNSDSSTAPDQPAADVRLVVVSCLDGGCRDNWSPPCQRSLVEFVRKSCDVTGALGANESRPCLVLAACGEPWDLSALDKLLPHKNSKWPSALQETPAPVSSRSHLSVLALHASTAPDLLPTTWPALHLSVAASSFGERFNANGHADPRLLLAPALAGLVDLLKPSGVGATAAAEGALEEWRHNRPHLAAYLYFRCDRPARERFLQLLRANVSPTSRSSGVIALGACNGSGTEGFSEGETGSHAAYVDSRFGAEWHDAAVAAYKPFCFVVCFENNWTSEGYITEKVLQWRCY